MKEITIEVTNDKFNTIKWLLGMRYGEKKGIKTLISNAVDEIIFKEAKKVTNNINKDIKDITNFVS
ncbi:hypothetical protein LCGC14_1691480 [marine sediment metagenome]|uniref:Uncharacterized protein n=1 Tax=marine sediment metagenome TaxID=412755 RepID=A0A0F9I8A7_9ZZZZ